MDAGLLTGQRQTGENEHHFGQILALYLGSRERAAVASRASRLIRMRRATKVGRACGWPEPEWQWMDQLVACTGAILKFL